LSCGEL